MAAYTFLSQTGAPAIQSDPNAYTMGVQFSVAVAGRLTAIWLTPRQLRGSSR